VEGAAYVKKRQFTKEVICLELVGDVDSRR